MSREGNGSYVPPPTPIMTQTPPASLSLQAPPHTPRQVSQPQSTTWAPQEPVVPYMSHTGQPEHAPAVQAAQIAQAPLQPGQFGQTRLLKRNRTNRGFFLSGVCLLLGGLILLFVYYMSLGLANGAGSTAAGQGNGTQHIVQATPDNNLLTPSPTPFTPTPTPFPGQHYVSNAQMASSVNLLTAKVSQPATTFKVNQRAYVTFQLHTSGQTGAVCLLWYLNGKELFNYPLSVRSNMTATYSYATYGSPGAASVQLYWASSTACTNEILAQQVNFTVTS